MFLDRLWDALKLILMTLNIWNSMVQVTHTDFKKAKEKVMFKKKEGVPEGLYM